ncbi:MAG TPA: aldehyde dehydrogenase family protein, partial [Actinomycetes bacterium]|nr:aldehyde dehydrogenase family protein [Actinomycetes bacterium]
MTQTQTPTLASRVGDRRADGGRRHASVNPAHTGEVVAEVLLAEPATFVAACRAAREAQPGWAATPAPVRGRAIKQLGHLVEENREALARLVTREIGKPLAESRGEVQEI